MARPAFKRVWARIVPEPIERSTYVMLSNAVVILLMWQWRSIDRVIWDAESPIVRAALWGLFAVGWLLVPIASLLINHFDLFGTRQVWLHLKGREYESLPFRTPSLYKHVRHPLYVGWMIAFWATPTMTVGHLLFAAVLSVYMILAAVLLEEPDLIKYFGEQYASYRRRVPMFIPRWRVDAAGGAGTLQPSVQDAAVSAERAEPT
jgi:protein-S-isoprenylcysteine O-methyltransferase Ste14